MSLAIKFGDSQDATQLSGFIYFDVVTKFTRQRRGDVTKHPLDSGASITDHYVSDNPKFQIVGVISSADLTNVPSFIEVDGETPLNVNQQPSAVAISNIGSGLLNYAPDSLAQFFKQQSETVSVDSTQRTDYKSQIESLISQLMTGFVYDEKLKKNKNKMTLLTLYGFENGILSTEAKNLVMTAFDVDEDADSGTGLFVSITLEQVNFVTLQKAELPKDVAASLNKAAQGTSNKAKADGTPKAVDSEPNGPGQRASARESLNKSIAEAKARLKQ